MEESSKKPNSAKENREGQVSFTDYSKLRPSYTEELVKSVNLKLAKLESMILALR